MQFKILALCIDQAEENLINFLATEILTPSYKLHTVTYNSQKPFKNVW